MKHSKRILIITDQSIKPIKFFIDQMPKLAKGLIRLGHDARIIGYSQLLRSMSSFKSRRLSAYLYKKKADQEIARLAMHYQPDIVYISFAKFVDTKTVEAIGRTCPQAVFIGGEGDPWPSLNPGRIDTAKALDFLIATNNGRFLEEYRAAGVKNCFFMPNICDPDIDHRYTVGDEWKSDILWTGTTSHSAGNNDCSREDIIKAIEPLPNVRICGCLGQSKIGGKDYLMAISGARLGIHVNAVNDVSMYHSDRLTHYLACGTCVLSKRVPDSDKLFRNQEHLVYFDTIKELHELIRYYLSHEEERIQLANQGMAWAHQEYNCQKIAQYILDLIEKGAYTAPWNS